ncbi:MAG TPA: hypothetical protein ENI87_00990, partial [bacterium]|nr:hypothetical protein [bacterium]
ADLRRTAQLAEHRTAVGLPVVRTWLLDALAQGAPSRGFLGGSITIAAMRPMRAVPVRCLFLCGLDDESFPRRDRPLPFDLIAAKPRPGDRSRRLDDRQLFLDLLLAARDRLHLTFVGHSAKDNSEGAPSVVLSELLDHVDRTCVTDDARTPRELVAVTHPLQPWSPRYHDGRDPRLFTFSLLDPPARSATPPSPWCKPHETLGAPPDDDDTIALDDLLTFWANPCRHFLTRTLQVLVQDDDDDIGDDEPFVVDNRSRWQLQQALVQRAQRGEPEPDNAFARVRQQGVLPVGAHGEAAWQQLRTEVEPLLRAARQHAEAHARAIDVTVSLAADAPPVRLVGEFDGFTEDHLLWLRAGSQRPQDLLSTWVMHLAVALQRHRQPDPGDEAPPWPRTTVLQFRDQRRRYQEVDGRAAERHLATLIRWYREGLTRPLPFFPQASNAAGEKLGPRPDRAEALRAGRSRYEIQRPNQAYRYDLSDQAIALCMRDRDPFADGENGEFVRIAADIWPPAIACLQEERS